ADLAAVSMALDVSARSSSTPPPIIAAPPSDAIAATPEVIDAFEAALDDWRADGWRVIRQSPPALAPAIGPIDLLMAAQAADAQAARLADDRRFDDLTRRRFAVGVDIDAAARAQAKATRRSAMQAADAAFADFDLWATPTLPIGPPPIAAVDDAQRPFSRFVRFANYLDLPACAFPAADRGGPPASLHLVSRRTAGGALLAAVDRLSRGAVARLPA
ncbi:MAG: amidase family protein, partial [Pseudomonadota bacterium]